MKLKIAALALLLSTSAWGQPGTRPALHNGSLMQVAGDAYGHVTISYVQPRPSLWGIVWPGMVLLQGQWHGPRLDATAFVFSPCGPVPYAVSGSVNPDGVLTVVGPAPLIDPYTCQVIDMVWSANSTLVFVPT